MIIFGMNPRLLWAKSWLRLPMVIIGVLCIFAAIWFGLAMTRVSFLTSPWTRGGLIALILGIIATVSFIRYRRRKKAAEALEENLVETPVGDGAVLAERMQEALSALKKSGGATYLYDLPWYVIIGPPGAGKTTALVHSGLEFPGTDKAAVAGFGGTKNCDFWFAEDAVMIDTAGRYTTQDSDARADRLSWLAFLEQLKRSRPNQPINGVILAFSCEEMMTAGDDQLDSHALTVRHRLSELQEALRIDVPVYVIFTKADMIAGFREYFGAFGEDRRKSVWGVTFQTKDRKEETFRAVPTELDALISRLSNEVTDRLNEEPDSVTRISIFGFPGQLALMQRNITEFLRRVFQKPTETRAILRGFYFTSGTQEGTPIDQVLGAMSTVDEGAGGFQPGFMSGKGRSYFLHDLLKKVIFPERDWVGYDLRAMRRKAIFRTFVSTTITILSVAALTAFGYSFFKNATLVRLAQAQAQDYEIAAQDILAETLITDPSPLPTLEPLAILRDLPAGYSDDSRQPIYERLGLSRRSKLKGASLKAYSDGLEQLMRPRLLLHLENQLPGLLQAGRTDEAYRALKVYMIVAKAPESRADDVAVETYFATAWADEFAEKGLDTEYNEALDHLNAMLQLDERVNPLVKSNPILVQQVQQEIATLSLARQAYSSILSQTSAMSPFNLQRELDGVQAELVFQVKGGGTLEDLQVPGLFTFTGYWGTFVDQLDTAKARLENERWVLGAPGEKVDYEGQLTGLNRDIHGLYQADFVAAWRNMLGKLELTPMADGSPRFPGLTVASAEFASPILKLAEAIERETKLSRLLDSLEGMDVSAEDLASGNIGGQLANVGFSEVERRSGAIQRIALNMLKDKAKIQNRVGGASVSGQTQRRMLEEIERKFEKWHKLIQGDATARQRPIDAMLIALNQVLVNRKLAATSPSVTDARNLQDALGGLTQGVPFYPETIIGFVNQVEREFLTESINASLEDMKRALNEDVTAFCRQHIKSAFPFAGSGRPMATNTFGEFFGYNGRMETYFNTYLREHTQRSGNGQIVPREGSSLGERLSPDTLKQFSRAEQLRQAFFEPGSARPSVAFSIRHHASVGDVDGSRMSFGGERIVTLAPNTRGSRVTWPDEASEILAEVTPQVNGSGGGRRFKGGRWSLVNFIQSGRKKIVGNRVDVTHVFGGRSVTFRLEFDSIEVPFIMREFREFNCPANLEVSP